jgi:TolB-like protein/tetratricopeptide (TPR) repeat protein
MSAEVKKEIKLEIGHVLFIDIVGYSKLLINEQRALLDTLNQIARGTEEFRSAEAADRLIKIPTGDGMALVFYNSPEAPVECALEISRALKDHPRLCVRMGVHSGPVSGVTDVNERGNVAGAGINVAQRVMDCGDTGHILLSKHVAEDLEQYGHWQPHLHDLGECEVKHGVRVSVVNLYTAELGNPELPEKFKKTQQTATQAQIGSNKHARPSLIGVGVFLIIFSLIGLAILAVIFSPAILRSGRPVAASPNSQGAAATIPEKSIAVLPFENLSEDKATAYFADGIQAEILTRLSKIADLKVISRTSTQHYKSAPENLPEIGKQLGVAHVVEGSVQKSGDAVRVNVQLIRAADDSHLWADIFDRNVTDVFSAESEIAKTVADQLGAKLTGREQQAISIKPTDVPEAYDAYLRGLAYNLRANAPTNILPAQNYLRRAVRLDPKFALAWALLCRIDAGGYMSGTLEKTPALREEANQAAETALALQPNLGEALYAKGYYHYGCLRDYDAAIHYFEQARQVSPNMGQIPEGLAYVARRRGEWNRSDVYFKEAEQLDPRNTSLLEQHALMHIMLRRFADAQREIDEALAIAPEIPDLNIEKAAIAQAQGDLVRAASTLAPLQILPTFALGVQTQCRQSIFEKNPAAAVARLQQVLAHADPAIPRANAELRFSLGWAQKLAGDEAGAHMTWMQARSELDALLKEQPENSWIMADLALTCLGLGDKAAALQFAEEGIAANPVEKDALLGPAQIEVLARVAAQTGEPDRAISLVEKLLARPYGGWVNIPPLTPPILQLDPMFDPLRNDPRFQKLASSAPKTPDK